MDREGQAGVEIPPKTEARASVIWLHGLGADGHDFVDIIPELKLPADLGVRFVFPHAPYQPVTINGGMVMRAWYDILGPDRSWGEDEEGIRKSGQTLEALIEREISRGIPANRIALAGFSQGGAIALHAGLRYSQPLAGILALSTYLPLADTVAGERHNANMRTPIFMAHGTADAIIDIALARHSRDILMKLGYNVDWRDYSMAHSVCMDEVRDIGDWLHGVFGITLPAPAR